MKLLRKEQTAVDNRLGVLFSERDAIESAFTAGGLAATAVAEKGKRLKSVSGEIETLEARWLELSTQIDEATSAN